MIPKETIQTILETVRIEDVIGEFVHLQKRGVNYIARCPFHDEKTPSFVVSPSKGIYKCFGCGNAGNAVKFLMEHEHFSYPEALKYLAQKYNIEIKEEELTPEQEEEDKRRELIYNINQFAAKFFQSRLFETEEGRNIGLSYFHERDFLDITIKDFQLGYAPSKNNAFLEEALSKGYKNEYLVEAGLVIEKDGKYFDRFAGRVIFPIHSLSGRVLGFGGRILDSSAKTAKYINSPDTLIYNKSQVLYGIFFAKKDIIQKDNCYLVEGYTDVISLFQAGIKNVVASSGTSLTTGQIKLIRRYTKNITILYDGDEAGVKASFRGIDMILEQGLNVKVLLFEEGQDPDTFVRTHRSSEVLEVLNEKPEDFVRFKTRLLMKEAQNDPVKKAGVIKDIVQSVALIPDIITREIYIKECANILEVSEESLIAEMNRVLRKKFNKKYQPPVDVVDEGPVVARQPETEEDVLDTSPQERDVLRLILRYHDKTLTQKIEDETGKINEQEIKVPDFILFNLKENGIDFSNPIYKKVLDMLYDFYENKKEIDINAFVHHQDEEISLLAVDLLLNKYEISKHWKEKGHIEIPTEEQLLDKAVKKSLYALAEKAIKKPLEEKKERLKEFPAEKADEAMELLKEIAEEEERWRRISKEMGRVIAP